MGGVSVGRVVNLVQHPAGWIVLLLAHIEPDATRVACNRLACVVNERLLEFLEEFGFDGHEYQDDMHAVGGSASMAPDSAGPALR